MPRVWSRLRADREVFAYLHRRRRLHRRSCQPRGVRRRGPRAACPCSERFGAATATSPPSPNTRASASAPTPPMTTAVCPISPRLRCARGDHAIEQQPAPRPSPVCTAANVSMYLRAEPVLGDRQCAGVVLDPRVESRHLQRPSQVRPHRTRTCTTEDRARARSQRPHGNADADGLSVPEEPATTSSTAFDRCRIVASVSADSVSCSMVPRASTSAPRKPAGAVDGQDRARTGAKTTAAGLLADAAALSASSSSSRPSSSSHARWCPSLPASPGLAGRARIERAVRERSGRGARLPD